MRRTLGLGRSAPRLPLTGSCPPSTGTTARGRQRLPRWSAPGWAAACPDTPRRAGGGRRAFGRSGAAGRGHGGARAPRRDHDRHGSLAAAVAAQRRGGPPRQDPAVGGAGPQRNPPRQDPPSPACRGGMHTLVSSSWPNYAAAAWGLLTAPARAGAWTPDGWRIRQRNRDSGRRGQRSKRMTPACWWWRLTALSAVGCMQDAVPDLAGYPPGAGPEVKLVTLVVDLP